VTTNAPCKRFLEKGNKPVYYDLEEYTGDNNYPDEMNNNGNG
jgi:hypothetical protein